MYRKLIIWLNVIIVVISLVCLSLSDSRRVKRVVGGMPVMCGEMLRIASLRNSSNHHLCGATIITADHAVTAAHCVTKEPNQYLLQLNNFCLEENATYPVAQINKIFVHPQYNKYSRAHDIAILQIQLTLDNSTWLNDTVLPVSSFGLSGECTIYGNGYTDPNIMQLSDTLQAAVVRIVSLDMCFTTLGQYVAPESDSGMLCALGDHSDTCQGDSGAPLICNDLLEGLSSYGVGCGVNGLPGVYTGIGAHISWINKIISPKQKNKKA